MPQQPAVVTPIIHLNGDRKQTLIAQLHNAYAAINQAYTVLSQCSPNGRNYYPEPGRLEKAQAQHWGRQDQLSAVLNSLKAEMDQIDEENPGK